MVGTVTNNRTTALEQSKPRGDDAFYWRQIFALDFVVVKHKTCLIRMKACQNT